MMTAVVMAMPGNEALANDLARILQLQAIAATVRRFPDGESYVRVEAPLPGRDVLIVCTLDRPDDKLVPLLLLACAAREAGARSVGLVAPYLAYMRQDARFHPGETISAQHVAAWIGRHFDWLVTVDPHLHRFAELSAIYSISTGVVNSAERIAEWLHSKVSTPLLIGPDQESEQWVAEVARRANAPSIVLNKTRHGDRSVEVSLPNVERWRSHTPVLVDDIVSTASTMIEAAGQLRQAGLAAPLCVAVHAVFAQDAYARLLAVSADVLSCDTIAHRSNRISLAPDIAAKVREFLSQGGSGDPRTGSAAGIAAGS